MSDYRRELATSLGPLFPTVGNEDALGRCHKCLVCVFPSDIHNGFAKLTPSGYECIESHDNHEQPDTCKENVKKFSCDLDTIKRCVDCGIAALPVDEASPDTCDILLPSCKCKARAACEARALSLIHI